MRPFKTIYPNLGKYFSTVQEIADAGCMSRTTAWHCLKGDKDFTSNQKMAITNAILAKVIRGEIDKTEVIGMIEGSSFDEYFKI